MMGVMSAQPWTFEGLPPADEPTEPVTLFAGTTFCVSGPAGDIAAAAQGLFVRDTRLLSRWRLLVDGVAPRPVVVQSGDAVSATLISRDTATGLLVSRHREIRGGMVEEIILRNTHGTPVDCALTLVAAGDFADLFAVKHGAAGTEIVPTPGPGEVMLTGPDDTGVLIRVVAGPSAASTPAPGGAGEVVVTRPVGVGVLVEGGRPDMQVDGTSAVLRWPVGVPGHGRWQVRVEVRAVAGGTVLPLTRPGREQRGWRTGRPVLDSADHDLAATWRQSIADLGALRMPDPRDPGAPPTTVAAGAPWFMALFGRDSLLTSWLQLPVDPELAVGTLRALAAYQGERVNPVSEEQPGRIPHELRQGAGTARDLGGSAYYGTADAGPLFVALLGELHRWVGRPALLAELLPHADRALDWIERYGDADGDGFVEYARLTDDGLLHQGWKDSASAITFADGTPAAPPIALAEVQGYTYAAYRARALLADANGDLATSLHCHDRAERLAERFDERFWLPDRGFYALGLDADKRPIDSLTSNVGHCLWSGIVPVERAGWVADMLLSSELFSGWGIRTLATSMAAYNPMSYHNGSVWPHDSAICAAGLMRYGFTEHAARVATGLLDAAVHFGHRMPEAFSGFARDEFAGPVPYPTSCSPQAWAAAAPLSLVRTLLRLEPEPGDGIRVDPVLPRRYLPLRLTTADAVVELDADRGVRVDLAGPPH